MKLRSSLCILLSLPVAFGADVLLLGTDTFGNPVDKADIRLTDDRGKEVRGRIGERIPLPSGTYWIEATSPGFRATRRSVRIDPSTSVIVVGFEVGPIGEGPISVVTVRVTGTDRGAGPAILRAISLYSNTAVDVTKRRDGSFVFLDFPVGRTLFLARIVRAGISKLSRERSRAS